LPVLLRHLRHAKYALRSGDVNIVAAPVRLGQVGVARQLGRDPQLDLTIVGLQQQSPLGGADAAAEVPVARQLLHIRPGASHSTRACAELSPARVDAAVAANVGEELAAVGSDELAGGPEVPELAGKWVLDGGQCVVVRRVEFDTQQGERPLNLLGTLEVPA